MTRLVLLVAKEAQRLSLADKLLTLNGYQTVAVTSAADALRHVRETHPCLVLLHLMMPLEDVIQFRAAQEGDRSINHIPVIGVSEHHDLMDIVRRVAAAGLILTTKGFKAAH